MFFVWHNNSIMVTWNLWSLERFWKPDLRAGCGIWLYQFLIIAYLFTLVVLVLFLVWLCGFCYRHFVLGTALLFVLVFLQSCLALWFTSLWEETQRTGQCASRAFVFFFFFFLCFVFVLHALLSVLFSSSWCRGLAAACSHGAPWTFLWAFL